MNAVPHMVAAKLSQKIIAKHCGAEIRGTIITVDNGITMFL